MFPSRSTLLTHIAPFLVYLSLALVTYYAIITSEGYIINGDFIKIPEVSNYFRHMYPLWNDQLSVPSIFRLAKLPVLAPFFGLGLVLELNTTQMMTIFSILVQTMAGICMYYAARYLLHKAYKKPERIITLAALIAGIIYMWSPYLINHSRHPLMMFAYGIAPLLLLCLIKGIEGRKMKYIVLSGLLWSLASADPHWMVYGAILIGGYILYSLLITLATKSEALTSSVRFQAKSLLVLIGSYVGLSAYWLVPGQLMGGTALYPHTFLPGEASSIWFINALPLNVIRGQAYMFYVQRYTPVPQILSSTLMQMAIILFSFGTFIFAVMALLLKPKNRHVLFLSLFLIILILLATSPNMAPQVYNWFVFQAPLHILYGWAFKTPGIYQFVILCFSFLSAFALREILSKTRNIKLANINLHRIVALTVVLLVLLSVFLTFWPLATGDFNETLRPTRIPQEFEASNTWLRQQPEDFKVLWMPKYFKKGVFWNPDHTTIGFDDMFSAKPTYLLLSASTSDFTNNYYFFTTGKHTRYPSLLYDNRTKELGKILAPLGIKYLIFHDDMPTQAERYLPLLNNLLKQNDLELIEREGFIWVFENKYYRPHFSISAQNLLIMGGLENLAALSSAPGFEPANTNIILADQELYQQGKSRLFWDSLVSNGSVTPEDLIFTLIEDEDIIVPSRGTTHFDPGSMWSQTTAIRHKWHIELEKQGLANWDFDYGKGLVLTSAPDTLDMSFRVEEPGSYDLFTRYFQNENGGMIRIWLDSEPIEEIATESPVNEFVWRKVGSFDLSKGKHELNLENVKGFNAVNLFALLASEKARQYEEQAEDWVRNKRIIYILEAESGLYYQEAEISEKYGAEASSGEVLQFSNGSKAWREIEILKDGDYRMAVRLEGSALVSIDNQSLLVNSTDLGFAYLAPIYLKEGKHRIEIGSANEAAAYLDVVWLYSIREESETLEEVFTVRENPAEVISYQKINATKYRVKVSASQPFMLSFAEAYNPLWVAKVNGKEYASLPLYSAVNGFWVEDKGELKITIEYKPQGWFYYGAAISAVSLFGLLAYLLWDRRREKLSKAAS